MVIETVLGLGRKPLNHLGLLCRALIFMAAVLGIFICCMPASANAALSETPIDNGWITNGIVRAIVNDGTTSYVGGEFTRVGAYHGKGVPLNASTGSPVTTFPKVNDTVYAVIPDGSGGWYIGGAFTDVGGVTRNGVARITSAGAVDPTFTFAGETTLTVETIGVVRALALDGSYLYVGGEFTKINGVARNYIARVDYSTGTVDTWDPHTGESVATWTSVNALVIDGTRLYVGGEFTFEYGGYAHANLVFYDFNVPGWNNWQPNPDGPIYCLAVFTGYSDTFICAGGSYSQIGGDSSIKNLARFFVSDQSLDYWPPNPNGTVLALAPSSSGSIYVGGSFTEIGGATRNNLAEVSDSAIEDWNPGADATVRAITVLNSTVYLGGDFTQVASTARNHLAAVDTDGNLVTGWAPYSFGEVYAMASDASSTVYAGGEIGCIGGTARNRLAAFTNADGLVTSWDPNVNDAVNALALDTTNSILYAGGAFTTLAGGSTTRNHLAAWSASTGSARTWDPNANGDVYTLALDTANLILYAGGSFTTLGGSTTRNRIAAIDASTTSTGSATGWDPNVTGSDVRALALGGSTIYAGGTFTVIGVDPYDETRNNIAAIDTTTGLATTWDPNADGTVYALALDSSYVYAGGAFTSIDSQARNRIAALDSNGDATSWDPNADGTVYALALNGIYLYTGGAFTNIGGPDRDGIACLSTSSGAATDWNPDTHSAVYALALSPSRLDVGGDYRYIGGDGRFYLAGFDGPTLVEDLSFKAEGADDHIALTWETLSETDNLGFHLWRARNKKGAKFFRITDSLIPAEGSPIFGASYSYGDFNVKPGKTYRYKLEDMDVYGVSTFHGPVKATVGSIRLVLPRNGALVRRLSPPEFHWEASPYNRFRIEISKTADFKGKIVTLKGSQAEKAWIRELSYRPEDAEWARVLRRLGNGGPLYWRVQGKNGYGDERASRPRKLRIR